METNENKTTGQANVCSICGKEFTEWPNDAWPVKDGICCDKCNMKTVVPARIAMLTK